MLCAKRTVLGETPVSQSRFLNAPRILLFNRETHTNSAKGASLRWLITGQFLPSFGRNARRIKAYIGSPESVFNGPFAACLNPNH